MATEAELTASAVAHAKATSIAWDEWLNRVRNQSGYDFHNTQWYQAGNDLEQIKHTGPPIPPVNPPVTPGVNLSVVRNLVIFATVTDSALAAAVQLGPPWRILFTSDPAYPVTAAQLASVPESMGPYAWSGPGIPPATSVAFCKAHSLPGWYGEGETQAGFDAALATAMKPLGLIGNLSALRSSGSMTNPDQRELVKSGAVLFNWEAYRNILVQRNADYESFMKWTGPYAGFGGYSVACYESSDEGAVYTPVSWYVERGYFVKGRDSVYAEGMRPEDWATLLGP